MINAQQAESAASREQNSSTPSPQPYPWGCVRMPAMAGALPGRACANKKIGSSCVRWPAIAGTHPELAVETKKKAFFFRCLPSSPPWPAAAVISHCSAISACEKCGQFQLAWQALLLPSAPVREVGNGRKHWDWFYGCDTIIWLLDVISYTFVIIACEKGGKWQQALGLLQECDTMFFSGRRHQLQFCNHCL